MFTFALENNLIDQIMAETTVKYLAVRGDIEGVYVTDEVMHELKTLFPYIFEECNFVFMPNKYDGCYLLWLDWLNEDQWVPVWEFLGLL